MADFAQPIAIFLTFLVAVMTQYLSVTKEVTTEEDNGLKKRKKLTIWGKVLLPIMSISALISFVLHFEDAEKKQNAIDDNQKFVELTKDSLAELVTASNLITGDQLPRIEKTCSEIDKKVVSFKQLVEREFSLLNSVLNDRFGKCAQHNAPTQEIDDLKREISDLRQKEGERLTEYNEKKRVLESTFYDYTLTLTSLNVSRCVNPKADGYYWDVDVGSSNISAREPANKIPADSNDLIAFNDAVFSVKDVASPSAQFAVNGYVREMVGRSLIRRYYQYRYSGAFSSIINYEKSDDTPQNIDITFSANNQTIEKSDCVFTIVGTLGRTTRIAE